MEKKGMLRGLALGCLMAALSLAQPVSSEAAGNIWMDESAEVQAKSFKKVVLFPIRYLSEPDGCVDQFQGYNAALAKRINKRIKRTNFMKFEDPGDAKAADKKREKREILRDDPAYRELLRHFDSEADRAKAVYDTTGAEGYLLPHIRYEQERVDHSPATWTTVKMESYYDIENGPQGDKSKCNYHSWYANHLIPAHDSTLQMLDMDFRLYDAATGKEAMTLIDYYRNYGVDQWHAFDQIAKNFTGDWNRLKKDRDRDVPAGAPTLGFRNLELPWSASQDEFAIKTIYYAYKDEAGDDLRRVKADYAPKGGRYYVTGAITDYARGETWCPPTASTSAVKDREEEFKWYDDKGNEHKGKRVYYKTEVTDSYGYYRFWYRAAADLSLVDSRTGRVVLSRSLAAEDDDRYANALRKIFKSFYKDVDKAIGIDS